MLEQLNKQQQRWLALGLLAAVVLSIALFLILPLVSSWIEYNETKAGI